MSALPLKGLGDPDTIGKQALFQPPAPESVENRKVTTKDKAPEGRESKANPMRRVHITTDLTMEALQTIQVIQQQHRLVTGKVLPMWKVVSQAIQYYDQMRKKS